MSPEGGINPMSGTVALQKEIASISVGHVGANFTLSYSGNVFKDVETQNKDVSSGIVGLGWSLGRAQIVCDCKENSFLDDDIYYLITAEGNRYKIFDQTKWLGNFGTKSSTSEEYWVIEGNPYWKIERVVGQHVDPGHADVIWKYVKGWRITDTEGIVHTYGDIDEVNSLYAPTPNATEYDLIWLKPYEQEVVTLIPQLGNKTPQVKRNKNYYALGIMENALGGESSFYPVAWNLSTEQDVEGNSLTYKYDQILEGLSGTIRKSDDDPFEFWSSDSKYTKETYLTDVYASDGGHVKFTYENKGEGEFEGEYKDDQGDEFEIDSHDMFKEKIVRKFLAQVEMFAPPKSKKDDNPIGKVTFCYSPLQPRTSFVKRLLNSIRFYNKDQQEIDFENYEYYTKVQDATTIDGVKTAYPLGALYSIKGKKCGWVEYSYWKESMGRGHVEELELKKIFGQGVLEDGTNYLVGNNKNDKLEIYTRLLGRWVKSPHELAKGIDEVRIGDAGWFLALDTNGEKKPAYVYQWNGKEWRTVSTPTQYTTKFDSPLDFSDQKVRKLLTGPDYVLSYELDDEGGWGWNDGYLKVDIKWSKWAGTENQSFTINKVDDNDGSGHRIIPLKNHILIVYQKGETLCSGNCLAYKVYNFINGTFIEGQSFGSDLDSENDIVLNNNTLIDAGEGTHFYNYSRVHLYNWNGEKYNRQLKYAFSNTDPADVPAIGDNYYVVRYSDKRFIRIFDFNGSTWSSGYFNKLLKSWSLNSKYYWTGVGGNDFIITTRAYQRKWYTTMHREARVKLIHKKLGTWSDISYDELGNSEHRHFIAGNDWFLEHGKYLSAWIWDGKNWVQEDLKSELDGYKTENIYSLGGNMFAASAPDKGKTKIFYKVNNSFKKSAGAYLVREKKILEPVTDQTISYLYSFLSSTKSTNIIDYDPISNTPLMDVMKVELPNGAGIAERYLCQPSYDGSKENVAVGNVCREVMRGKLNTGIISETRTSFVRDRKNEDLYPVYVDKPSKIVQISRGIKTVTKNTYSKKNGMIQKIEKHIGNRTTEEVYKYLNDFAPTTESGKEILKTIENQNRINVMAGSYSCIPNCNTGMIVSATANGFEKINSQYVITSSWKYAPKKKESRSKVESEIANIAFNGGTTNGNWEPQSHNSRYLNKQVVETEEGPRKIKVASFLENKENGKMFGNAANCGIDEGLMLSGENCNVANWSNCKFEEFSGGYAPDIKEGKELSDYGRFSKKALKLNTQTTLIGTIAKPRKEAYKFSAWMQLTKSNDKLNVSVDGKLFSWDTKPEDLKNAGKWQYIEKIFDMSETSKKKIYLSTSSTSSIYLQDVRILPLKATSTASFWNDEWDKIQTTVDNRGIGSYVKFDNLGRELETYSETAEGDVYLASKTTIVDGNCSAYPNGSDLLKSLKLNGNSVDIPTNGKLSKTYSLSEISVPVEFETLGPNDRFKFSLVPFNADDVWQSPPCCAKLTFPVISFSETKSWMLKIDVEPYGSNVYEFTIKKKENDWVEYGDMTGFANGILPKYQDNFDSSSVLYKDKFSYLRSASFDGNKWEVNDDALFTETVSEFYPASGNKASSSYTYLAYISDGSSFFRYPKVFYKTNSKWNPYNDSQQKIQVNDVKIVEDANKNLVMIYNRELYISDELGENGLPNTELDNSLRAKVWNKSKNDFEDLGSTPVFDKYNTTADLSNKNVSVALGNITEYKTGVIEDGEVFASDITVGPYNKLYVAYLANSKMLSNDELKNSTKNDENSIDALAYSVPFVYIKQLYEASETPSGKQIWAAVSQKNGTPVSYGDVLSWSDNLFDAIDNVKRFKLASDGTDLYLAVMYEMSTSDDEDDENSEVYTVLTVFKGEIKSNYNVNGQTYNRYLKWTTLKDNSINTVYHAKNLDKEREIIAYLNDNDDFDFEVRKLLNDKTVPFIMFRTADNHDDISVISYKDNRWLSIGNPAFAKPQMQQGSTDLGVNKDGNPFVVFQSNNYKQKNRLVGMHYNAKDALDLTLSAFETTDKNFNSSCAFRQYILYYKSKVTGDDFTFKITPKTVSNVKEIQLYNSNGWNKTITDYTSNISIPIADHWNDIEIKIVGTDESSLTYMLKLYKEPPSNPVYGIVSDMAVGSIRPIGFNSYQLDILPTVNDPNLKTIVFDIHFKNGWTLIWGGKEYVAPTTIPILKDELPMKATFKNEKGEEVSLTIRDVTYLDPTFDPSKESWFDPNDEYGGNGGSGGGSGNGGSGSGGSGGGSGNYNDPGIGIVNTDISENVPDVIRSIANAKIYSTGSLALADRVTVSGNIFAGSVVNFGVTTTNNNNIYSGNSVVLRNNAIVNGIYYVNNLELQDGAKYNSATKLSSLVVPVIPTYMVSYGTSDVLVESLQTRNLSAGSYRDFTARNESNIHFEAGDYYFRSFYADSKVNMTFAPGTRIWIAENLRIGNENKLQHNGKIGDLFIYVGQNASIETKVYLNAVVVAPNADVRIPSGGYVRGYIYAKSLDVQPDCTIE